MYLENTSIKDKMYLYVFPFISWGCFERSTKSIWLLPETDFEIIGFNEAFLEKIGFSSECFSLALIPILNVISRQSNKVLFYSFNLFSSTFLFKMVIKPFDDIVHITFFSTINCAIGFDPDFPALYKIHLTSFPRTGWNVFPITYFFMYTFLSFTSEVLLYIKLPVVNAFSSFL